MSFKFILFAFPHSLHIIQDRYATQHGGQLDDISLCSSGNIAVSGHRPYRYPCQSYVCIYGSTVDNSDSRDKPTLLYHRQFTDEWLSLLPRYISFIKPNSTEIVTCRYDGVQVIDYNRDVVLRSRKVNGEIWCLSVSESQIFIGLGGSYIVNIYDNDLNRIKSIRLKGIRVNWPVDIAAAADRLYVCTAMNDRAIVYSQDSGSVLTEYTIGQERSNALSIAVNIQYQIVAVLWDNEQVAVYSINNKNCLVVFDVESDVSRIRISDKGRIVTGNEDTGEVKIYDLGDLVFHNLSAKLAQLMSSDEIKELRNHFNILDTEKDQSSEYSEVTLKTKNIMTVVKERGILYPNKANELKTLFDNLASLTTSKLSGPIRLYEKVTSIHDDMPQHGQPTVNAGSLNESFSVSPTHEIPEGRFPKQDNWQNLNLINVVNTMHGLVCYIRSGKKRGKNVLTQLFKLPSLDSSDNPQVIYSKVKRRQGYNKLFLAFIDETHLVMCYNKTLQIIDINSKEVVRGHQLRAAARTMDVEAGKIFIVVGNSSVVLVFNQNLEEITKLTFTLKDWKYPADMKVTSERLFIICKVKPRDHVETPYNWSDRAMSFKRVDGEMEANFTFPGEKYTEPVSIAAHKESEFVGVLWSKTQHSVTTCMVSLHTLSGCCVLVFDGEHSHRIQILNKNTMILLNETDGLKFYNMAHFITINLLAICLSYSITLPEYEGLQNFYGVSDDEINAKDSGSSHVEKLTKVQRSFLYLFKILEERDLVGPNKFDDFIAADAKVRASLLWNHVEAYWKLLAEIGLTQSVSLEAGPSKQDDVPVTQEGGAENRASVSQRKEATAQLHSLYPVEWNNGEVIWTLDPKKQTFIPMYGIMTKAGQIELKNKEDDFMSLPGTSSTPFGKWPTKRPLSKMLHSDMKLDIAAKRLKMDWNIKLKSEKEYKKEEAFDLSEDSMLEEPYTSHVEEKFVKEEIPSQGVARAFIKEETADSDSEQILGTVSPIGALEQSPDAGSYTSRKTIITKVGGTLEISNTGILLVIPPNALPADKEEHEIYMRYIPRRAVEDQVKCFSSNSTAVIEILPNLHLRHPVRLSLPHCLVLQQILERKAKIFASHHEKGTQLCWEEQKDVLYHVEDTACIMLLNSFSWYKYCIDDEIVIAKKMVVYAAAQETKPHDGVVRIEVGCYPDLPGQEEDISGGQNLIVAHKKILYFVKSEKQHPLQISLNDIFPSGWQCRSSSKLKDTFSKKILYSKISEDLGDSCIFILQKPSDAAGMPLCVFTASQEKDLEMDNLAVQLAVNFQVIDKVPPTLGVTGHQCKSSLTAESIITKSGVELEIPGTGVVLKIPPNAVEGNGENHFVGMRIISSRIIPDQGISLSTNSCTAVELYPHTVSLRHPVELRLPHCLTFNENSDLSARIFTMYLKENTPKWRVDTDPQYKLDEKACFIKLNKLCCVQYFIDDNIVKGKKIGVYTAAKKLEQKDEAAELEVGFYSDIPGGGELLRMNPNFTVDSKKKFLFMRKPKCPLQLSLDDIVPSLWECWFPKDKPQDIPVEAIAASIEHSNLFILKKTSKEVGSAICTFTTLPKEGPMSLEMALTVCPQDGCQKEIVQSQQMNPDTDSMTATFQLLAKKLTDEWKPLGRKLHLEEPDIYRIERDFKRTEETIYQMLQCWKKKEGSSATYAVLVTSLVEVGRRDLAEKVQHLKDVFEEA